MHEELWRPFLPSRQVKDNRLTYAPYVLDGGAGKGFGDLFFGRFERLRFAAGPHASNALSADARVDAVGDGFDFGKFRHGDWMQQVYVWPRGGRRGTRANWRRRSCR